MFLLSLFAACAAFFGVLPVQAADCPSSVTLYYSPYCGYSRRVLDAMDELHVKMPMKDVTISNEAKEELRVKGGRMQVPCLMIDGRPLYSDTAIVQWIKDHRECLARTD